MEKRNEFFVHLKVGDGAATLAVVGDRVGVSLCSPTEQFNRKVGRTISRVRAASEKPTLSFPLPKRPEYEGDERNLRDLAVDGFREWIVGERAGRVGWLWRGARALPKVDAWRAPKGG